MNKIFTLLCTGAILSTSALSPCVMANDTTEQTAEPRALHASLEGVKPLTGKINTKADYYIYLQSASWCGPCVALMPDVVKEYKKFKRKKIELILVCADKTEDDAKNYVKKYKAGFPMVMSTQGLLGYAGGGGIPNATIVDADGKQIAKGNGRIILDWKKTIAADVKAKKKAAREAAKEAKAAKSNSAA